MIIDTGGYLGNFPFRKLNRTDPFSLSDYASSFGITHMIVSSIEAVFFKDPGEGNNMLSDVLKGYVKKMKNGMLRYIQYAVINPAYPGWKNDLIDALENKNFHGIDLFPQYHSYPPDSALINPLMDIIKKRGVPVRISNGFENIRQRSDLDVKCDPDETALISLAKSNPDITFIFNGFSSYEFYWQLKNRGIYNVYYDFSRLDIFRGVNDDMTKILDDIGTDNLCFSSFSPFQYIEPQILKITHKSISETDRDKILSSNLKNLLPGVMT